MLYCCNDFNARQLSLQIYENLFSWEQFFENWKMGIVRLIPVLGKLTKF